MVETTEEGQGRRCGRAQVARRRAAQAHPSRARDGCASSDIAEVVAQTTTEVSLVEDNHVVEQFASDGANDSLGERVDSLKLTG